MKISFYIVGLVAGILSLTSCSDSMGLVGPTIQKPSDTPEIRTDTFMLSASTVRIDSIYARTSTGLLGEMYDPLYGYLKSDYMCQFYIQDGFRFRSEPVDGKIDSIKLFMYYGRDYIGDSTALMQAAIYPVANPLERNYYTNIDPTRYADMSKPLAVMSYTPRDYTVSDAVWNNDTTVNYVTYKTYSPRITITLPVEFGQNIYDETINNPASFATQDAFNKFFPGFYITNSFGNGNLVNVSSTSILIYYKYYAKRASTGAIDSVVYENELLPSTREVIQMNRVDNAGLDKLLADNDQYTYMKTPAGVFTRITIPMKEILPTIEGRRVNTFRLRLRTMPQDNWKYALEPPRYVMLMPEDSAKAFFEKGKVEGDTTAYLGIYRADSLMYQFSSTTSEGNLAELIKYQQRYAPDKDLNMVVIPVQRDTTTTSSGTYTEAIYNYMKPSGVTIRKDGDLLRLQVITTRYPEE